MGVDSYLQIFTIPLGWYFYNVIWDVLATSGIVYLPFLGILIDSWQDAYVVGEDGNGAGIAVRKMEIELYMALTVVMLACVPTGLTPIARGNLFYEPPATTAEPTPTTATGTAPDSTYGTTFASTPATVNVPVWWYSVLALTSGLNQAIVKAPLINLEAVHKLNEASQLAKITNPQVASELNRFQNECMVPARTLFLQMNPLTPTATSALATYGKTDTEWAGSHVFRDEPTLYASLYASTQVEGFPFNPVRDADLAGGTTLPTWGRPTCKEWWETAGSGLRSRLISEAALSSSKLAGLISTFGPTLTAEQQADQVAQVVMDKTDLMVMPDAYTPNKGIGQQAIEGTAKSAALTVMSLLTWINTTVLRPALPFAQALILMAMCLFLAPIMIFSRYSLSAMVAGALAIFTVKFWTVMWWITDFLYDKLAMSLYPTEPSLVGWLTRAFDAATANNRVLLDIVFASGYVGLPLIWTAMMSVVGIKAVSGINSAMNASLTNTAGASKAVAAPLRGVGGAIGRGVGALRGRGRR